MRCMILSRGLHCDQIVYNFIRASVAQWIERLTSDQ